MALSVGSDSGRMGGLQRLFISSIASHKWIFLRACQDQDFKNNPDKLLKRKGRPLSDYVWLGLGICDQYSRCFAAILIGVEKGGGGGFLSHQAPGPA